MNAPTLDDIRARCAQPVTEIVANPGEYYRVQTILRDRAELLRLHDALAARLAEAERLLRDVREYGCLVGSQQWSELRDYLRDADSRSAQQ